MSKVLLNLEVLWKKGCGKGPSLLLPWYPLLVGPDGPRPDDEESRWRVETVEGCR